MVFGCCPTGMNSMGFLKTNFEQWTPQGHHFWDFTWFKPPCHRKYELTIFYILKITIVPTDHHFGHPSVWIMNIHTWGCKWVKIIITTFSFIRILSLRQYLIVWSCVCHKKPGPLDTFLNKLCSNHRIKHYVEQFEIYLVSLFSKRFMNNSLTLSPRNKIISQLKSPHLQPDWMQTFRKFWWWTI